MRSSGKRSKSISAILLLGVLLSFAPRPVFASDEPNAPVELKAGERAPFAGDLIPIDLSVELAACPGELDMIEEQLYSCERSCEAKLKGAEELTGNADDDCEGKLEYLTGLIPAWYEHPGFTIPATVAVMVAIFLKVK